MKKIELSKEEYELAKRINKNKVLKHFNKYYFIYDNLNELKLVRYLILRDQKELSK